MSKEMLESRMSEEMLESRMSEEMLKQVQHDELQQVERDGFAACSSSISA